MKKNIWVQSIALNWFLLKTHPGVAIWIMQAYPRPGVINN